MKSNTNLIGILAEHGFSAGEEAILALLLSAVDPIIGGVLLVGHEEKANEAAIKCLAALLPPVIEKRRFHSGRSGGRHFSIKPRPLVTIPADFRTENLDGDHEESDHAPVCPHFCPDLLTAADQGVLYVPQNQSSRG
jgi:hypothetical protein